MTCFWSDTEAVERSELRIPVSTGDQKLQPYSFVKQQLLLYDSSMLKKDPKNLTFKLFVFCTFSSRPTAEQGTNQNIVLFVPVVRNRECAEAQNVASKCSTFNTETWSGQRIASCEKLRWIESMGVSNKEMRKDSE
jgi:hypothetical protein